jgi:cell division protein FtsW (lipid II flippase)
MAAIADLFDPRAQATDSAGPMLTPAFPHLWHRRLPWSIPVIRATLVVLGWLGLGRYADLNGGDQRFLRQQMVWSIVAAGALGAAMLPSYRVVCRWSYGLTVAAVLLLVLAYLFPPINGARRWVRFGPLGFQPSEFAKLAFVLALARYLTDREPFRRPVGVLLPLAMALVPVLLILRQAKQIMALGGVWGSLRTGRGAEDPAAYHLPEAQSDFIFSLLVERLGLLGGAVILGLYGVLVWRGLAIAAATRKPFGRLVAKGISIGLLLNIALRPGYEVAGEPFRYVVSPPSAGRRAA